MEDDSNVTSLEPRLVASNAIFGPPADAQDNSAGLDAQDSARAIVHDSFKSAQWSSDGTCVLTTTVNDHLETFIAPADLLTNHKQQTLAPYASLRSPEPIYAFVVYPWFNLSDPATTLALSSIRDHPLRLVNALAPDAGIVASYPLIHPTTEAYITPHSLTFTAAGTHFIAGSEDLISVFDVSRNGQGSIEKYPTIPSRRNKMVGGGVGMKGIVSTLSVNNDGLLAAGTFSRCVALYASEGRGDRVAVFSIVGESEEYSEADSSGITQVLWSPCGRYLYVGERKSDGVLVYDVRVTGRRLGWLKGRKADTNQRLGVEVVPTAQGHEVWAGGTDGSVRVWSNPGDTEGALDPWAEWKAHDDPVCAAVVHSSGSVVATCSGRDRVPDLYPSDFSDSESESSDGSSKEDDGTTSMSSVSTLAERASYDASLKLWSL